MSSWRRAVSASQWSLQEAKNKFSAVVDAARREGPQTVTRRGVPAVVVVATEEYERLRSLERLQAPSFVEHLLALPQDDEELDPADLSLRDAAL
jgi:antitoxin Phd